MNEVVEVLSELKVVDKPDEAKFARSGSVWTKIVVALKNLASDKSIFLTKDQVGNRDIKLVKQNLWAASRKLGIKKTNVIEKDGGFYFYTR